jgi:4-aminobutyrate---pyruvate transaminase
MTTSPERNSEAIRHVLGVSNLRAIRESNPLTICRGDGAYIFDEYGKDYLDASSSFYCAGLGYGCQQEILDAIAEQIGKLSFCVSASSRTTDTTIEFAERLSGLVPIDNARILFGCSGSEANDFLIKILRYREILKGETNRRKIISRRGGYHGGTIATAALGGDPDLHESFGLDTADHLYVSQPDYFNSGLPGETEAQYVSRLADELIRTIEDTGPEKISAFFIEPVNFSSGFLPPPTGYMSRMSEITRRYGISLIADEIVTGFGRTGALFGSDTVGLVPDCLTLGKAMGGAYFPMSAAVIDGDLYDWLERGSDVHGAFGHASTFSGHPIGAAIGLKILEIFEKQNLLAHI